MRSVNSAFACARLPRSGAAQPDRPPVAEDREALRPHFASSLYEIFALSKKSRNAKVASRIRPCEMGITGCGAVRALRNPINLGETGGQPAFGELIDRRGLYTAAMSAVHSHDHAPQLTILEAVLIAVGIGLLVFGCIGIFGGLHIA